MSPQNPRINGLRITWSLAGNIFFELENSPAIDDDSNSFIVHLDVYTHLRNAALMREAQSRLQNSNVDWISYNDGKWWIDYDRIRMLFPNVTDWTWVKGKVEVPFEVKKEEERRSTVVLMITEKYMEETSPQSIFLSHKWHDKEMVREYARTLVALGLQPWLDEDAMPAGTSLERGLYKGMENSCAAVFFISKHFKDERYLAAEIDYAIQQKRAKADRFAIITLVFAEAVNMPPLLNPFVWKRPSGELEALREIIKALPLKLAKPAFQL